AGSNWVGARTKVVVGKVVILEALGSRCGAEIIHMLPRKPQHSVERLIRGNFLVIGQVIFELPGIVPAVLYGSVPSLISGNIVEGPAAIIIYPLVDDIRT